MKDEAEKRMTAVQDKYTAACRTTVTAVILKDDRRPQLICCSSSKRC